MSRNPVFEHFRQQGMMDGGSFVLERGRPGDKLRLPAFSYYGYGHGAKLGSQFDVIRSIKSCSYPLIVLADSSLFAQSRIELVQALLKTTTLVIHPDVRAELADIERKPSSPMRDLLFPDGRLSRGLSEIPRWGIKGFNYVVNKYTNLLHLRKRLLELRFETFRERTGREPMGKERTKIVRDLLAKGASWRTIKLGTKEDRNRRLTDEALVVHGVLTPILTGKDCYILTADRDVFDQFYQLTELVYDDFASHWIGEDFRRYPDEYDHVHESKSPYMEPGALAIGRQHSDQFFHSTDVPTCATAVFDVSSLEFLHWVSIPHIAKALHFQECAADGRVADGGNGNNVYMSLGDPTCSNAPAHFTVGKSVMAVDHRGKDLKLCLTQYDITRAMTDRGLHSHLSRSERRQR